ncbi:MAG: hypothetical protein HOW73_28860 [Polyangiaceae bacterium]|nr:hypothetical protein [Polyangiaceae bacterium]
MAWASTDAHAADVELTGTTAVQAYEVASPWGYELERRRILQMVGFSLYHLQGDYVPGKADYNVRVLMRVDADVGLGAHLPSDQSNAETDYEVLGGTRFVPGLVPATFDLMAAYVEGKNLANGYLSFRAGRQYVTDVLGWWSFDGGLLRIHTPAYVDVELYGGFEQRGGIPISTSRYESQGVWRGSHAGFDEAGGPLSSDYPSYQFASYAPAFGAAVEAAGPSWLRARLTYRRVYNTGEAFTRQFPDMVGAGYPTVDGLRISSDRLGFASTISKSDLGGIKGGFSYDFYNQLFPTAYGGIEAYVGDRVTLGLDADHYSPTFDADSIFNWFTHNPTTTATGRVEARITREIDLSAQGGLRVWETEGDPEEFSAIECAAAGLAPTCKEDGAFFDTSGTSGAAENGGSLVSQAARAEENRPMTYVFDGLGQLAARWRSSLGRVDFRGMVQAGERGHRIGADASAEKTFDGGRYAVGARVSVFDFGDGIASRRPDDPDTTSFSYVLGAGFKPIDLAKLGTEFEHAVNERVGQRFRVLARLDLQWAR